MGNYEYRCLSCGHEFPGPLNSTGEKLRCPRCGGEEVERNVWLLGSPQLEGLSEEDYFAAGLKV